MKQEMLEKIVASPLDRRKFVTRLGATGLGVAAMGMVGGGVTKLQAQSSSVTDADILTFALNLEYLEAEFYSVAAYGATLKARGVIPASAVSGPTTGGQMVPNFGSSPLAFLASGLLKDEQSHVLYLRQALGSAAVPKPAINLNALGFGFASVHEFIMLGSIFEDVGVSAYLGAAPLIKSNAYLDAAARILSTEAQHAGSLRLASVMNGVVRPAVDGKDVPPTQQKPFDVDSNGLSIPRSTSEVLSIVYGGGAHSGGFFPNGLNGNIK